MSEWVRGHLLETSEHTFSGHGKTIIIATFLRGYLRNRCGILVSFSLSLFSPNCPPTLAGQSGVKPRPTLTLVACLQMLRSPMRKALASAVQSVTQAAQTKARYRTHRSLYTLATRLWAVIFISVGPFDTVADARYSRICRGCSVAGATSTQWVMERGRWCCWANKSGLWGGKKLWCNCKDLNDWAAAPWALTEQGGWSRPVVRLAGCLTGCLAGGENRGAGG